MPRGSGRRPKPTKLKRLAGNPGKRELNKSEPMPSAEAPDMPPGLPKLARREWESIVPQLERLGMLSRIDGKALAAYCHAYARWVEAEKQVHKYGMIIEEPVIDTATGAQRKLRGRFVVRLKKNPAVSASNEALKLMKSFLIEFGMTPAARSRLHVEKQGGDEKDPLEAFLERGSKANENKHVN